MQVDDGADELRLGAADILDGLAGHRLRQEAHEIAGMAGLQGDADLAVMLHAADAGAMARARVEDDERAFRLVDHDPLGRGDADQRVIDGAVETAAIADHLGVEIQDVRRNLLNPFFVIISALSQNIHEQDRTLHRVLHIFDPGIYRDVAGQVLHVIPQFIWKRTMRAFHIRGRRHIRN